MTFSDAFFLGALRVKHTSLNDTHCIQGVKSLDPFHMEMVLTCIMHDILCTTLLPNVYPIKLHDSSDKLLYLQAEC